jgi:hypothetical protein
VGLERGLLSLVSTTEELLDRKVAAPVQVSENTAAGIRREDYSTPLYPQKLELTSAISGGRSVGIFRSRTKATEFIFFSIPDDEQSTNPVILTLWCVPYSCLV